MKSRTFKSAIMLTLSLATAAVFSACKDNGNEPANIDLPAQFANVEIADTGGSQTIQFSATADWTVTINYAAASSPWLTISPTSGKAGSNISLTLTVQPNTTDAERSLTVTITAAEAQKSFSVTQAAPIKLAIGDSYQGGIIAYIDETGKHGLIAAPTDQSDFIPWDLGNHITTNATGTAIGTGMSNTNLIVAAQGDGKYAAKMCADLVLNGYDDWFLPSKDELVILYQNRYKIGSFDNTYGIYWSSTEDTNYKCAWVVHFHSGGNLGISEKLINYRLRAVRAF